MYCTECKCCLAQKDVPVCIFCEDGVPCPGRKRQVSGLEAKPSRPLVAEMYATRPAKAPKPQKRSFDYCEAPGCDVKITASNPTRLCSAHDRRTRAADNEDEPALETSLPDSDISSDAETPQELDVQPAPLADAEEVAGWLAERDSYREKRKKEKKELPMPPEKQPRLCKCGCGEIAKSNASPYAKGHKPNQKKNTESRVCSVAGCGKQLRADNKSGICTPHQKGMLAETKPSKVARSKSTPPRKLNSTPAPVGVATISVTETHLDYFWSKLTLDEKATIFTRQLEGA
jgi:hypothetical protein